MNNDSYKIIISLSHHRIAFEYWLRDGENKLVPMPNMSWPAPLAFYCSQTGIEIGDAAVRAVNAGTPNAFDNYFERLTNDETYLIGGRHKPLRYLLLDATETIFADFFKNVLFGSKGSLSDNRATMPVTLVCEPDIKSNERALLFDLFKGSGYNRFKVVEYNTFIGSYIRSSLATDYAYETVLVAWTEGTDLTFTVFDVKNSEPRQASFPGLGVDPRLDYVKKLIWERIKGQNSFLPYYIAEETISKAAADFLSSTVPLVNDTLTLADGFTYHSYHYSLDRAVVDNLQCNESTTIRAKLDEFLRENNLPNRKKILLLLRGIAAGNIFFEQTLSQGFGNTVRSNRKLRTSTMQLIIADSNPVIVQNSVSSNELPETQTNTQEEKELERKWRDNAQSAGKAKSGNTTAANEMIHEDTGKLPTTSSTDPIESTRSFDLALVKRLEREWREIRAAAKGKTRSGNIDEAIKIFTEFIQKVNEVPGTEDLRTMVKGELSTIVPTKALSEPNTNGSSITESKGDRRTTGSRTQQKTTEASQEAASSSDKGEVFISEGKLKDARDWYRASGNSAKAKVLSELIRSQKGVELRKRSLEECRRNRNADQIKRIITELQDYIALCKQVNYTCDECNNLLLEYKKLTNKK